MKFCTPPQEAGGILRTVALKLNPKASRVLDAAAEAGEGE